MEGMKEKRPTKVKPRAGATRCPFCHDDVHAAESAVCQDCLARHHPACWQESGSCASCSSENQLQSAPRDFTDLVVREPSREKIESEAEVYAPPSDDVKTKRCAWDESPWGHCEEPGTHGTGFTPTLFCQDHANRYKKFMVVAFVVLPFLLLLMGGMGAYYYAV